MNIEEIIYKISQNTIFQKYILSVIIFFSILLVSLIIKGIVLENLKKLSKKININWDNFVINIIESLSLPFYIAISLIISINFSEFPKTILSTIRTISIIVIAFYAIKSIGKFGEHFLDVLFEKGNKNKELDKTILSITKPVFKIFLWLASVLVVLQNMGYQVTALLGGLGIGGIAIAFALQNILVDVFSFFTIYFDKPFEIGDFIAIGEDKGTITNIGIKTTRLKTLKGQELIISNKELTGTRIQNFKKMEERRIVFTIGVIYETSSKKLKKIPLIIKKIISEYENSRLDRVHFISFGDFSLNIEIVYFIKTPDYKKYANIRQNINFAIKEQFEQENIEFAYPTQTIYFNNKNNNIQEKVDKNN